jgi:hypothetical protein
MLSHFLFQLKVTVKCVYINILDGLYFYFFQRTRGGIYPKHFTCFIRKLIADYKDHNAYLILLSFN